MTKNRRRPIHLHVMVSEAEQALIQERMAEAGIRMLDPLDSSPVEVAAAKSWK